MNWSVSNNRDMIIGFNALNCLCELIAFCLPFFDCQHEHGVIIGKQVGNLAQIAINGQFNQRVFTIFNRLVDRVTGVTSQQLVGIVHGENAARLLDVVQA